MPIKIPVAHDFVCPWCWIALSQTERLRAAFDVDFEWLPFELYPEGTDWPDDPAATASDDRPRRPNRLSLAMAAEGLPPTEPRPTRMRTHNAHEAVEYAKTVGVGELLMHRLYRAHHLEGQEIDRVEVLAELAEGLVPDVPEMLRSVEARRFKDRIVPFDDEANARGVYALPTFWIDGERYLEQPYSVLRAAVGKIAEKRETFYSELNLPQAPVDRPYLLTNMVATIDGKTVTGDVTESVLDLGSKVDHRAMHRIERQVDAVMIGASTLRASPATWRPSAAIRIVVSGSGNLPWGSAFLNQDAAKRIVLKPTSATFAVPQGFVSLEVGNDTVDWAEALRLLRQRHGVERLLVEGGSELNGQLFAGGFVDEAFLTIAPKVKLGRGTKTYAGGDPLPKERLELFSLVESTTVGDEVFLRYRRR